jgi:HEAT repeat protein
MSPMTVFVRALLKSSAICLGVALAIVQPSFGGGPPRRAVAQQSPTQAAIDGLVEALRDPDPGVRRNAAFALGELRAANISRQALVASRRSSVGSPSHQSRVVQSAGDHRLATAPVERRQAVPPGDR